MDYLFYGHLVYTPFVLPGFVIVMTAGVYLGTMRATNKMWAYLVAHGVAELLLYSGYIIVQWGELLLGNNIELLGLDDHSGSSTVSSEC